jgi:hypothetical protein
VDRFVQLAERIRGFGAETSIILTGLAPERPLIHEFMDKYSGYAVDASESGSLEKTAALLRRCDLIVSNDTGIMHLAAAMGTPTGLRWARRPSVCSAQIRLGVGRRSARGRLTFTIPKSPAVRALIFMRIAGLLSAQILRRAAACSISRSTRC